MPRSHPITLAALCAALAISSYRPARATAIVDQSDTVNDGTVGATVIGQSFTAGVTGQLSSIFLASAYTSWSSGADTVSIYRGDGVNGTALLASGLVTPGTSPAGFTFNTTSLGAMLAAGQQYTFDITAAVGQTLYLGGDATGSYAGGQIYYANVGYPAYDLAFDTVVNVTAAAPPVPEPASLALLGSALAGVLAIRRRKLA